METSIIIAQIISVIYLSIGIGLIFNNAYYVQAFKKIVHDSTYLLLGGWIATVLGVVLVNVHNLWVNDWRLLLTIISWIILAKGILLLAFPPFVKVFESWFTPKNIKYILPMVVILGFIFGYYGFFAGS